MAGPPGLQPPLLVLLAPLLLWVHLLLGQSLQVWPAPQSCRCRQHLLQQAVLLWEPAQQAGTLWVWGLQDVVEGLAS
jgi:hypothetical protein